jgi:glutathione S-transferase
MLLKAIGELEKIMATKKGKFLCGDNLTIPDLLFYFCVCNLSYFGKNQSDYPNIAEWFGELYQIK